MPSSARARRPWRVGIRGGSWTTQINHTSVLSSNLLNEARVAYLHGDPVTMWEAQDPSTTYTRGGSVPFTIGESRSADLFGHQIQFADTLSWARGRTTCGSAEASSITRPADSAASRERRCSARLHSSSTTTAPFEQLTLADVQQYSEPVSYGITSYELKQWMSVAFVQDSIRVSDQLTVDAGLRYDRQTLTDATKNFAPRLGFGWHPNGDPRTVIRGGYAMYYTQIRANALASALTGGLDGLVTYTATPGQTGFPTCSDLRSAPPRSADAAALAAAGPQHHHSRRRSRLLQSAVRVLRTELRSAAELSRRVRESAKPGDVDWRRARDHEGPVRRGRLRPSALEQPRSHVDLNAPTPFDRTAIGQTRTVAAANATRPIVPVNGGVRTVNVLMNLGVADYDGLQTQVTYRGNAENVRGGQLHAGEGDQHDRARRQRHQSERLQHRTPWRRGARPERRRSAASRGDHLYLQPAVSTSPPAPSRSSPRRVRSMRRPASTTTAMAPTTIGR